MINERYGYREVAAILRARITAGELRPGARMPSERDLQQTYGVARETARRAARMLAEEGLIDVRHGYPSRVRPEQLQTEVIVPSGAVLTSRMPTPQEREDHDIGEGVPVVEVTVPDGPKLYAADRYVFRNG